MVAPCCLPCLWLLSVLCTLTQPIGTQRDTDTSDRSDSIGWLSFALINLHAANLALTRDQRGEPLLGANVPIPTTTTPARGHAKTLENTGSLAIRKGPKTVTGDSGHRIVCESHQPTVIDTAIQVSYQCLSSCLRLRKSASVKSVFAGEFNCHLRFFILK